MPCLVVLWPFRRVLVVCSPVFWGAPVALPWVPAWVLWCFVERSWWGAPTLLCLGLGSCGELPHLLGGRIFGAPDLGLGLGGALREDLGGELPLLLGGPVISALGLTFVCGVPLGRVLVVPLGKVLFGLRALCLRAWY